MAVAPLSSTGLGSPQTQTPTDIQQSMVQRIVHLQLALGQVLADKSNFSGLKQLIQGFNQVASALYVQTLSSRPKWDLSVTKAILASTLT